MKYLALLSGGKDSCFNLLHCAKNGHELVAAASLGPGIGKEELDSYLYQTVGQDAIELVARALEVPLYRRVITGTAIEQGSEYGSRNSKGIIAVEGDETEDLLALLSEVKVHHPDVLGVSVGAILSNYQRVRVEHVCRRLGLTPLCYLWNRDQGELFEEMISAGMNAILIKVAGIGLTTKHLGKTLAEMQSTLLKLNEQYGAHICGEGGEYESLTLDCPLFKHRIVLSEVETVIHSDNSFATVAFLRIKNAHLEAKTSLQDFKLDIPAMLQGDFVALSNAVEWSMPSAKIEIENREPTRPNFLKFSHAAGRQVGPWVSISNIERVIQESATELTIEEEVAECFQLLETRLNEFRLDISNCTNINIFLSDISLFARVNAVYATFFGSSPPARACVAVDLPYPIRIRLDCTAFAEKSPQDRQALHVQGLSYWAPANIGPYSQAITAGERIFISGQIGLTPAQLSLPSPRSLAMETALASQHVSRVIDVLKSTSSQKWIGHTQLALYWITDINSLNRVKSVINAPSNLPRTPTLYLVIKDLPKNALVEKQVLVHTGRFFVLAEEDPDDVIMQSRLPVFEHQKIDFSDGSIIYQESSYCYGDCGESPGCVIICLKGGDSPLSSRSIRNVRLLPPPSVLSRSLSIRLFYNPSRISSDVKIAQDIFGDDEVPPMTPVPCSFISTNDFDDLDCVLCILQA